MKIALIIKDLRHCGAQRAIARLSHILSDAGHEVYMILFSGEFIEYEFSGKLVVIDSVIRKSTLGKIRTVIQRTRELGKVKRIYKIEAAISFLDTPNICNLLTKRKEKVYISVRNYKSAEDKGLFRLLNKLMIKLLYPKSDRIIAVSKVIEQDLVLNYGLDKDKIKVIYNPYDIDQISKQYQEELPDQYKDFFKNNKVLITVGRLSQQKGYWNLLKVFSEVKKSYDNVKLVIIGDGEQKNQLMQLAHDLKIEKDVLLAGYQKNPFVFIKNAHLYIMTSLFEGFPNALVEAMACGIPVVSVDCKSGPREILYKDANLDDIASKAEPADYGILCPPFSEKENWDASEITDAQKEMAAAVVTLLKNKELYSQYATKALERAYCFTYEECKKHYQELLMG